MFTFSLKLKLPKCRGIMTRLNVHTQKKEKYNYFTSENVMDYRTFIEEFRTNSFSFETVLKYRIVLKTPINVLQENYALCKENKITFMSPLNTATLLSLPTPRMRHNIGILKECGSIRLTDYNVARLPRLMKLQLDTFKNVAHIPQKVNVAGEIHKNVFLKSYNSTVFENLNEDMTFFELRFLLIPHYVYWKFNISISNQIKRSTMRNIFLFKSWHLVNENVDFLKNNIGFKYNTKSNNMYAVKCDLNNVRRICEEIKNIDKMTMKEVINKCPQILLQSADSIKEFLTWYRRNRLKEYLILNNLKVLSLNSDEAIKNLEKILRNPALANFQNHPRFLNLLFVNHDLTKRIAYLESNNMTKSWKNITISFSEMNKIRIDKILNFVRHRYKNYRDHELSPSQHLALCVYHLEVEYHFSGDSILHTTDKRVENKS
ncbi:uncharacterized protein LOC122501467 isoform X2 [Leptopilina heterotoma]|uniref:uncharacterized protein LOC122501467 isoform X2 n=1 Tax=Leptopilina heterotoma TaxID=63436 RepID=UPI001CA9E337|nr:uncharacterized protein LOC122501467 isoform X2 [Leptopilina heterotoma]